MFAWRKVRRTMKKYDALFAVWEKAAREGAYVHALLILTASEYLPPGALQSIFQLFGPYFSFSVHISVFQSTFQFFSPYFSFSVHISVFRSIFQFFSPYFSFSVHVSFFQSIFQFFTPFRSTGSCPDARKSSRLSEKPEKVFLVV